METLKTKDGRDEIPMEEIVTDEDDSDSSASSGQSSSQRGTDARRAQKKAIYDNEESS